MMNLLKKNFAFLLAVVLCLSLTACSGNNNPDFDDDVGGDWRVTGIVRASGTITRDGEDTTVLVCVHKKDATFYYDTEDQTLFGSVDYPITLGDDVWDRFKDIDFADLNGDGNSDVTMKFNDGDNELLMVWFWDTESSQFVYQPEESQLGEEDEGRGDLIPDDGDIVQDEGGTVPVLMNGALPFTNMETLRSENNEDGTYYYSDVAEDGLVVVVNTVLHRDLSDDTKTLEEYLTECALSLGESDNCQLQTVEENNEYTKKMTYPVYIVTYTTGANEDTREWTVFAMDTDLYTYLYGISVTLDAADDVKSVYQDIFEGLYMSDGE